MIVKSISIIILIALLSICMQLPLVHATRIEMFSAEENQLIEKYKKNKNETNLSLVEYITNNLNSDDYTKIYKSFYVVKDLSILHRKKVSKQILKKTISMLSNKSFMRAEKISLKFPQFTSNNSPRYIINQAFHSLAYTRDEECNDFLIGLIYPTDRWNNEIRSKLLEIFNDEPQKDIILNNIRLSAYGSLLQPLDEIGQNKLPELKTLINSFNDSDPIKNVLFERHITWEKIYSGEIDVNRYKD